MTDVDGGGVGYDVAVGVGAVTGVPQTLVILVTAVTSTVKQATNQTSLHVLILVTCAL